MPSIENKGETEEEDMEQDSPESEKSDDDESDSGSASEESDESSELNESECDSRRIEHLDDMLELERQFDNLKDQLYTERLTQIESKLEEVRASRAPEYLQPLARLQEEMRIRITVAGILQQHRIVNIENRYCSEKIATEQNYASEKELLYDSVKNDLEDKIRRLEEDRHNIDISSDLWQESQKCQKSKRRKSDPSNPDRRRKPTTVSGPYIVYMLKDVDIIEDWSTIKKAVKQSQRTKKDNKIQRADKYPHTARYDDGKLFYEGDWYSKGHHIIIDNKKESPVHATVTAINTGEVWVKRFDGEKSKLYIAQLQKGKYTIRHVPY
ncbi:unnamed protein product [Owenia fusiformis]|uniref:Breast cancer metastasis-suppressor 1-like protein n=1 Tax=Owenia fusiformis TaxID=6347 RepID=A0A8S4PF85_OWEFU|nr:unnamed protein product [Owenia fusiformis]